MLRVLNATCPRGRAAMGQSRSPTNAPQTPNEQDRCWSLISPPGPPGHQPAFAECAGRDLLATGVTVRKRTVNGIAQGGADTARTGRPVALVARDLAAGRPRRRTHGPRPGAAARPPLVSAVSAEGELELALSTRVVVMLTTWPPCRVTISAMTRWVFQKNPVRLPRRRC
jgi:hypothetical protein